MSIRQFPIERKIRWLGLKVCNRKSNYFLDSISRPVIKQDESVDCKLKQLGIAPSEIDYLFFSHMDFDHTSGLRLVKDAKQIMAAKEEIADSQKILFPLCEKHLGLYQYRTVCI